MNARPLAGMLMTSGGIWATPGGDGIAGGLSNGNLRNELLMREINAASELKVKTEKKEGVLQKKQDKFAALLAKKPAPENWNKGELTVALAYKGIMIASKCAALSKDELAKMWKEKGNMFCGGEVVNLTDEGEEGGG